MTRTVAAELDLITEVIEREGAVAAQQIARSLGMSMSIVAQDTRFVERRRIYDLTGLVVRRELLALPEILTVDLPDNRKVNARIKSGEEFFDLQFSRRRVSASNPHQLIVYLLVFGAFFTVIAFFYLRNQLRPSLDLLMQRRPLDTEKMYSMILAAHWRFGRRDKPFWTCENAFNDI